MRSCCPSLGIQLSSTAQRLLRHRTANGKTLPPWGGAGIPAVGDTVTVSHQITTAGSLTIGHSPGANHATAAVQINGGTLTIGPSTAFTCRGDIRIQPGTLVLEPGSTLEMDSSQASNPATSIYVIDIVPTYGSNDALLFVLGTAAAHARIRAHPAGAHTRIADGNYTPNGGRMIATYCDFERLGGRRIIRPGFTGPQPQEIPSASRTAPSTNAAELQQGPLFPPGAAWNSSAASGATAFKTPVETTTGRSIPGDPRREP